jgi:hypothetical protein
MTMADVQPIHSPNAEAMRQHLDHMFGGYLDGYHEGLIELCWTETRPNAEGKYRLSKAEMFGIDQIEELIAAAVRLNSQPMCNVYVGAALRKPGTFPGARASDADAFALTCGYVDLDDPGAATDARNKYGKAKPTMIVVTGREPHIRAQMWWRLDEPLTDPDAWPALLKGMSAALGGDPTVTNPSRVMRLAGTIAWPVKEGRTIELTAIPPGYKPGSPIYTPDHLAKLFPPVHENVTGGAALPDNLIYSANSLGLPDKIKDGREEYMVKTIGACLIEYIGETGLAPTARELFDISWPQYERKVDFSRSGRGADEFAAKCRYTVVRFAAGKIKGIETLGKAIEVYRNKQRARHETPGNITTAVVDEPGPIDVGGITGEPKSRKWLALDWIPEGVVSSLSGDGGTGKTLLAQQLLYAAGTGGKWLGMSIPPTRGLGVFCEDDADELHRRHNVIKADLGYAVGNPFTGTWIWPRVGHDNLLVTFDRDNKPQMSAFFAQIGQFVLAKQIGLLILDTITDLFGGNEIIRAQVNYFIKTTCGAFIKQVRDAGSVLSVLLLSHPSQAGRNSGTGESGSTAWNNAVRARLYLMRPEDGLSEQRVLTRKKSNYSASGDDVKIDLLWSDGVLRPVASCDNAVVVRSVENQIVEMVGAAWDDGHPYKAKRGDGAKFLDSEMVRIFRARVAVEVIIEALRNLKGSEEIVLVNRNGKRGWSPAK